MARRKSHKYAMEYRGFDIEAHVDECMAGYELTYFSAFKKDDGFELTFGYTEGTDPCDWFVENVLKMRVDEYWEAPWEYDDTIPNPNEEDEEDD